MCINTYANGCGNRADCREHRKSSPQKAKCEPNLKTRVQIYQAEKREERTFQAEGTEGSLDKGRERKVVRRDYRGVLGDVQEVDRIKNMEDLSRFYPLGLRNFVSRSQDSVESPTWKPNLQNR